MPRIFSAVGDKLFGDIDKARTSAQVKHATATGTGLLPKVPKAHPAVRVVMLAPIALVPLMIAWSLLGKPGGDAVGVVLRAAIYVLIITNISLRWGVVYGVFPKTLLMGRVPSKAGLAFSTCVLVLFIAILVTGSTKLALLMIGMLVLRAVRVTHFVTLATMRQRELARLRKGEAARARIVETERPAGD